jgi:hypothetical protein
MEKEWRLTISHNGCKNVKRSIGDGVTAAFDWTGLGWGINRWMNGSDCCEKLLREFR